MKNKNQQTKEDVFMQIEDVASREMFMLKVPANYGKLLDDFGRGETAQDYRNDQAILKLFCDTYAAFSKKKREDFEVVLNSGVARTDTFADLVTLALQMHKYYRLKGIASKERLGRMHILSAKANDLGNWVAMTDYKVTQLLTEERLAKNKTRHFVVSMKSNDLHQICTKSDF